MGVVHLMMFMALVTAASAVNSCPPSERRTLLALKSALDGSSLAIFKSWTGYDCCRGWKGISCDPETGRVAEINLRGETQDPVHEQAKTTGYMSGRLSPVICKLTWLSSIIIADWKGITGEIPRCITSIPYLRIINLMGNRLSGTLPEDIGRLHRLAALNVADNLLSGQIPSALTQNSHLMLLDLRNNRITGPLPGDLGRLRILSRVLLSGNHISGRIPNSISQLNRLADLDLSLNRLSGPIPESLGKMPVLASLNLENNQIWGVIPASLFNSSISNLNLSNNTLDGNLPDNFGSRSYFMMLDLSYNNLRGPIPRTISSASYIGHLDLSHNHLCGRIPDGSPFDHLEASSFTNNDCLCGKPLKPC